MSLELQNIFRKIEAHSAYEPFILATVVDVRGSSYRLPGAKMLIDRNGETVGMVSGGCLEADVLERARRVLQSGAAEVFTYDMTDTREDSVFSLNMGCRGVIRILLEKSKGDTINFYRRLNETRRAGVAATLIAMNADAEQNADGDKIGARLLLDGDNIIAGDFDDQTREELLPICREVLRDQESKIVAAGRYEFFLEYVAAPLALHIFGAGADAVPLAEIGAAQGWQVTVFDYRSVFLTAGRFPNAQNIVLYNTENLPEKIVADDRTAAIVMTHNYERDREILRHLLKSEAFYIGALGPRRRTDDLLSELIEDGESFTAETMQKLFAPVGLSIGADTPESIALSIAAEIQAVLKAQTGGSLRDKTGSIYNRKEIEGDKFLKSPAASVQATN